MKPVGGYLSDKFGAQRMMYWVFDVMLASKFLPSLPDGQMVHVPARFDSDGETEMFRFVMNPFWFTDLVFIAGVRMGVGKAAVYKYIPEYFPKDVSAV